MDMRLAPLDTPKTEVCKFMWKYCDNPIRFGAMSPRTQPICVNLVYMGDFVLSYLLNPTTYGYETCTTGYNKDCGLWKYCDNPIRFGAMSPSTQPICVNLVYMGEFVLSYLLNLTTYGHETCTIGYNEDGGL